MIDASSQTDYFYSADLNDVFHEDILRQDYDDFLNEEGPVTVAGIDFDRSEILQDLDPIAYRTGFSDWLDSEGWEEISEFELERFHEEGSL